MTDKNKNNKFLTACLIIVICVLVTLTSVVFAKYYKQILNENTITSANMIVVCKDSNGKTYDHGKTYYALEGNPMKFLLSNYDIFGAVESNVEIKYSVELKKGANTVSNINGTFAKGAQPDASVANIASVEKNTTYTITVTVTEPFYKVISFNLVSIPKEHATYYDLKDHGDYVQLDLYVGKLDTDSINVDIDYSDLSPDNANPLMTSWIKASDGTIKAYPYSHYTLHFAKNGDTTVYKDVVGQTLESPYKIEFKATS